MKRLALDLAAEVPEPEGKLNLLREYLQACALRSLHESGAFTSLSFGGGTALRFLYRLPRFSEDLDFSLEGSTGYDPEKWLAKLNRDFRFQGFEAQTKWNPRSTVQTAWIRVPGILAEAGIVRRSEQKLSVKLEIDTRPPAGAILETRVVNHHRMFAIRHHDLGSLFAGKIRALLTRPFQKGRDWYDLIWYLGRVPPVEPNEGLLAAALAQPARIHHFRRDAGWKASVAALASSLDMSAIRADVRPFLENPGDADLLTLETIQGLLAAR